MPSKKQPQNCLDAAKIAQLETQLASAKTEIGVWKHKYNRLLKHSENVDQQMDVLLSISNRSTIDSFERAKKGKGDAGAFIFPACDWHVDEIVEPDLVNGMNCYNQTVAEERIKRYYSKVLELIDWYRRLAPISELWHPLLGDFISGYIHPELEESNVLSPAEGI